MLYLRNEGRRFDMGGIPSVVEEVIDSIVDLVGVTGFSVPYILMFAAARDYRQSPV